MLFFVENRKYLSKNITYFFIPQKHLKIADFSGLNSALHFKAVIRRTGEPKRCINASKLRLNICVLISFHFFLIFTVHLFQSKTHLCAYRNDKKLCKLSNVYHIFLKYRLRFVGSVTSKNQAYKINYFPHCSCKKVYSFFIILMKY